MKADDITSPAFCVEWPSSLSTKLLPAKCRNNNSKHWWVLALESHARLRSWCHIIIEQAPDMLTLVSPLRTPSFHTEPGDRLNNENTSGTRCNNIILSTNLYLLRIWQDCVEFGIYSWDGRTNVHYSMFCLIIPDAIVLIGYISKNYDNIVSVYIAVCESIFSKLHNQNVIISGTPDLVISSWFGLLFFPILSMDTKF